MKGRLELTKEEGLDLADRLEQPMQGSRVEITVDNMLAVEGKPLCPITVTLKEGEKFSGRQAFLDIVEQTRSAKFVRTCVEKLGEGEVAKFEVGTQGFVFERDGTSFPLHFRDTPVPSYLFKPSDPPQFMESVGGLN